MENRTRVEIYFFIKHAMAADPKPYGARTRANEAASRHFNKGVRRIEAIQKEPVTIEAVRQFLNPEVRLPQTMREELEKHKSAFLSTWTLIKKELTKREMDQLEDIALAGELADYRRLQRLLPAELARLRGKVTDQK